jgi:vacuolar protein sorting-associated protein 52
MLTRRYQIAPSETIFRSALLVLLDNASAEYSFIRQFFKQELFRTPQTSVDQPIGLGINEDARRVPMGSEVDFAQPPQPKSARRQSDVFSQAQARDSAKNGHHSASDDEKTFEAIWKQIFDPVLPYVQVYCSPAIFSFEMGPLIKCSVL